MRPPSTIDTHSSTNADTNHIHTHILSLSLTHTHTHTPQHTTAVLTDLVLLVPLLNFGLWELSPTRTLCGMDTQCSHWPPFGLPPLAK